jgi:hypothetical protein
MSTYIINIIGQLYNNNEQEALWREALQSVGNVAIAEMNDARADPGRATLLNGSQNLSHSPLDQWRRLHAMLALSCDTNLFKTRTSLLHTI